jgi:hypothetical protein
MLKAIARRAEQDASIDRSIVGEKSGRKPDR